jgi:hypothetical protein
VAPVSRPVRLVYRPFSFSLTDHGSINRNRAAQLGRSSFRWWGDALKSMSRPGGGEQDSIRRGESMDLKVVREEAIEATTRAFWDRNGFVPDEDSDEWEEEYRSQFEQARRRHATGQPVEVKPSAAPVAPHEEAGWAVLTGAPTQIRWAAALRADRLQEVQNPAIHDWLATTWTKAKSWIDTRDLPTPTFLQRIEPHYAEYRRRADEQARALEAERQAKAAAAEALQAEIDAAGM